MSTKAEKNRRFKQKTAKTLPTYSFQETRIGAVAAFASFARDQRTLVWQKASRRGVTPV
jgi:hypothetical protein